MRIYFDRQAYTEVLDIVTRHGGQESDFKTEACVELGDDESYIEAVTMEIAKAGIPTVG